MAERKKLRIMSWKESNADLKRRTKPLIKAAKTAASYKVKVPMLAGAGHRWLQDRKKKKIAKQEASGSRFSTKYDIGASKNKDVPKTDSKRYSRKAKEASKGDPKGPFGGKNPFIKKERTFGDDVKAATSKSSSKSSSSKSSSSSSKSKTKSNIFTKHYKTGKELGVMTNAERRAYDKEAAGRTFKGQVKKHHESSGSPSHLKETKYKASERRSNLKVKKRERKSAGYQFSSNIMKHYNK